MTLTDDRGLTPVDLAKTRKLKAILKEAWTEATQSSSQPELAPVKTNPGREGGSRLSLREESPARRRGGEVIFDVSNNLLASTLTLNFLLKIVTGQNPILQWMIIEEEIAVFLLHLNVHRTSRESVKKKFCSF